MTFIIDKTGTIRSTHNSLSDPQGHVKAARQAIETLAKSTI
jgi:peroxiredoxin